MAAPGPHARRRTFVIAIFLSVISHPLLAQSIVDARRVEFLPSADNSAIDSNGVALVDHYTMEIFQAGGTTVVATVDLGKPLADADGYMRVDFVARLSNPLTPGVSYEAVVSAVGPGGSAASGRSNTFGFSEPCSFSLSPQSQSFSAGGGTGSFDVATGTTCQWTAVSQASWVTVIAGASNTGPATVSFSVAPSTDTTVRSATVLAAGWNFTVLQAAVPPPLCTDAVSPTAMAS